MELEFFERCLNFWLYIKFFFYYENLKKKYNCLFFKLVIVSSFENEDKESEYLFW